MFLDCPEVQSESEAISEQWNAIVSFCIFQLFWSEFQSLGVLVADDSCYCENEGEHWKLSAPTEITSTGYKCNTLVCTGRRHPGLS